MGASGKAYTIKWTSQAWTRRVMLPPETLTMPRSITLGMILYKSTFLLSLLLEHSRNKHLCVGQSFGQVGAWQT